MVPKKRLRAAGDIRKLAKGHSTESSAPMKTTALTAAVFHGFQSRARCQSRSSRTAGTMIRIGNCGGRNWVTWRYTGPSFGSAGKSGSIQIRLMMNSM
jgi:hypothetical protein